MLRSVIPALMLASVVLPVQAQEAERYEVQGSEVTLILHGFLTEEETNFLRTIAQEPDALALFLPEEGQFGAFAVSPDEGLIRDGVPVGSAMAIGDLPDLAQARNAALEGCDAARASGAPCEIVLEIAPR